MDANRGKIKLSNDGYTQKNGTEQLVGEKSSERERERERVIPDKYNRVFHEFRF